MSVYYDCPNCGATIHDSTFTEGEVIECSACDCEYYSQNGLNRRSTLKPMEGRGFFGRMFQGSTIQKSLRERLIDKIKLYDSMANLAASSGKYQEAQFHQMRASEARRQLGNT